MVDLRCGEHTQYLLERIHRSPHHDEILVDLVEDAVELLRNVLLLLELTGDAGRLFDPTYSDRPSIGAHGQNSDLRHWTLLVDLLPKS